jgi:hypothetical protein
MAFNQGKNVPQHHESATKKSSFSNAIPAEAAQVATLKWGNLLHRCNK